MTQPKPIPKLDLAPKLNRPLSLWNPLDYLRLLYWCFYFPQALRWYEEKYGGGESLAEQTTWQKKIAFLRQHPHQLKLWIQVLLLSIIVTFVFWGLLDHIGFSIPWRGVALGLALGIGFGLILNEAFGLEGIVTSGFMFSMLWMLEENIMLGMAVFSVVFSVFLSRTIIIILISLSEDVVSVITSTIGFGIFMGIISGLAIFVEENKSVPEAVLLGVVSVVATCVGYSMSLLRPDNWLIYSLLGLLSLQNDNWLFPHITPLPLPSLESKLKTWLRQDWQIGLENTNELLRYSFQFTPVIQAVNHVLAETPPEQLIFRVSQLAATSYDLDLVRLASTPYNVKLRLQELERGISFFGHYSNEISLMQGVQRYFLTDLHGSASTHAVTTGFWHLYKKRTSLATKAFSYVRDLLYGEEMYVLAHTLTQFHAIKNPDAIAKIQLPSFPSKDLLRPTTWNALNGFRRVVEDTKLVINGTSKAARSLALNRAIGQLRTILDNADTIPKAEQGLIVDIARTWTTALEGIAQDIGNIAITEPIQNPYVIGDPVEGSLFVGREDIIRQLEELWVMSQQLQSVVLYGHRRMGKTSILRNIGNHLGADIQVVYINLQRLGTVSEGMGEVLMAMSDGIADALQIPPPEDEALLQLPQRTFERYLKKVVREMPQKGLIIALDEFEMIEELIEAGQIPANFMGVLRSWVQLHSKVAFVFAGLHTLAEMKKDYFQPFFTSVIDKRVSFIETAATQQLLKNPNSDFLLNYTGEALDLIYQLTSGQPYLVQLIGFLLVRRYNDQVFELGRSRDWTLTVEDVEAIINHSDFLNQGDPYFTGVWGQAAEGSIGQQKILIALAIANQGLTVTHLCKITGLDETVINQALDTLKRHDVVKETKQGWQIVVELFRRWVSETIT